MGPDCVAAKLVNHQREGVKALACHRGRHIVCQAGGESADNVLRPALAKSGQGPFGIYGGEGAFQRLKQRPCRFVRRQRLRRLLHRLIVGGVDILLDFRGCRLFVHQLVIALREQNRFPIFWVQLFPRDLSCRLVNGVVHVFCKDAIGVLEQSVDIRQLLLIDLLVVPAHPLLDRIHVFHGGGRVKAKGQRLLVDGLPLRRGGVHIGKQLIQRRHLRVIGIRQVLIGLRCHLRQLIQGVNRDVGPVLQIGKVNSVHSRVQAFEIIRYGGGRAADAGNLQCEIADLFHQCRRRALVIGAVFIQRRQLHFRLVQLRSPCRNRGISVGFQQIDNVQKPAVGLPALRRGVLHGLYQRRPQHLRGNRQLFAGRIDQQVQLLQNTGYFLLGNRPRRLPAGHIGLNLDPCVVHIRVLRLQLVAKPGNHASVLPKLLKGRGGGGSKAFNRDLTACNACHKGVDCRCRLFPPDVSDQLKYDAYCKSNGKAGSGPDSGGDCASD